ncbi:hypothetical protein, partial [Staphylococcus aureus]|uniref:hypothetical protein n=1 Tax=Staphylococcus aureus TaxID=1280 RepID=UPI001C83E832
KALVQDQASRLKQLEHANLEALAQNQELQLKNDNLSVQVQVLQSERSAQMFLYGAVTPPTAASTQNAKPAPTSATVAKPATTTAPTTTQPLTAEQIAKNKQQQDAKFKALVQDQASRLKQLEHANLEALAQNQELQLKN